MIGILYLISAIILMMINNTLKCQKSLYAWHIKKGHLRVGTLGEKISEMNY